MPCFLMNCISAVLKKGLDKLIYCGESEINAPPSAFFKQPRLYYNHPNKYC